MLEALHSVQEELVVEELHSAQEELVLEALHSAQVHVHLVDFLLQCSHRHHLLLHKYKISGSRKIQTQKVTIIRPTFIVAAMEKDWIAQIKKILFHLIPIRWIAHKNLNNSMSPDSMPAIMIIFINLIQIKPSPRMWICHVFVQVR